MYMCIYMHIFSGDNIYMLNYKLCIDNILINPLRSKSSSMVNLTITESYIFVCKLLGSTSTTIKRKKTVITDNY